MNSRESKGKEIAEKQDQITRVDETHYKVNSQSRIHSMMLSLLNLDGLAHARVIPLERLVVNIFTA